jgi:hypothetical protein
LDAPLFFQAIENSIGFAHLRDCRRSLWQQQIPIYTIRWLIPAVRGARMDESSNTDIRKVSREEFLRDSTKVVREAADAPVMVCDEDGTPRMLISSPVLTDDHVGDP